MVTLRSTVVLEAMLVGLMVVGAVRNGSMEKAQAPHQTLAAMEVTGPRLAAMPRLQPAKLADHVNELLAGRTPEGRKLRVFVNGVRVLAQPPTARERCVCYGDRATDCVCRQMGELLLRQQALEREGRKQQVAAFLDRVRQARANGMPEAQVRSMVRDGLAKGELCLSADEECRAVRQQLEDLNRKLVAGEVLATGESVDPVQVSVR